MDQFSKIPLAIDKVHTVPQKASTVDQAKTYYVDLIYLNVLISTKITFNNAYYAS